MSEINKLGIPAETVSRLKNYDNGDGIFEPKEIANMPEGDAAILIYYFIAENPSEEKLNTAFVILNQLSEQPVKKIAGIFSAFSRIDEFTIALFVKLVNEKPDIAHAVALEMAHPKGVLVIVISLFF